MKNFQPTATAFVNWFDLKVPIIVDRIDSTHFKVTAKFDQSDRGTVYHVDEFRLHMKPVYSWQGVYGQDLLDWFNGTSDEFVGKSYTINH